MLPTGNYGGGGYNHLSFRDDPRGYRKKGSLGKQLSKLFPVACSIVAILLTMGVIYQHSNLKHWKAEHAKVQGLHDTRGEDAKRLQRMLSTERDTTRRQSQEITKLQGSVSNLEAEGRVSGDQRRKLQDAASEHQKKVDELVASLNAAEGRRQQEQDICQRQRDSDSRRIQNLQLTADNHHKLWAELNQRLRAVTAQHELKESEWNTLKADMEAQLAQDRATGQTTFTGAVDAADVARTQYQQQQQQPVLTQPVDASQFVGRAQAVPQQQQQQQQQQQPGPAITDPEVVRLAALLSSLGIGNRDGQTEQVIVEFMRTEQREAAYPGLEQPVQGDPARRLADLMMDRGLVAPGPTHEFLVRTLGNYVSSSSALQMLGRNARASAIPVGNAQHYPSADASQGAAADAGHVAGRKEMPERQPVEQQQQQQQQSPAAEAGAQEAAKSPEQGHTDPATAARDRWHAFRRARERDDAQRVKPDAAGFVA